MKEEILKLIEENLNNLLDDITSLKVSFKEKFESLETVILLLKKTLKIKAEDVMDEHFEKLINLLQKSGINSKQKTIEILKENINDKT